MWKTFKALALAGAMMSCASASAVAQPAPSGGFVDVSGGKLWYETCGSGARTMVLLHDGVLHSATWDEAWPLLCKSYRVIRYDRRGYGRSPEATASYSELDDLRAVIRASGAEHPVLVGASSGGGIALDYAIAHPDDLDRLVLVGPAAAGLPNTAYFAQRVNEVFERMGKGDPLGAIKMSWLLAPNHEAEAKHVLMLLASSPQDLNHKQMGEPLPPVAAHLRELRVPTLILVGEADVADNQGQAAILEYGIPGARRVIVRDAGHLLYMEQPEEFARLISEFGGGQSVSKAPGG